MTKHTPTTAKAVVKANHETKYPPSKKGVANIISNEDKSEEDIVIEAKREYNRVNASRFRKRRKEMWNRLHVDLRESNMQLVKVRQEKQDLQSEVIGLKKQVQELTSLLVQSMTIPTVRTTNVVPRIPSHIEAKIQYRAFQGAQLKEAQLKQQYASIAKVLHPQLKEAQLKQQYASIAEFLRLRHR